jgi:hypothetical protein
MGGATVLGAELLERWRDMGSTLWLVAAGAGAAWAILFAVLAAGTDPGRSSPGPRRSTWAGASRRRSSTS